MKKTKKIIIILIIFFVILMLTILTIGYYVLKNNDEDVFSKIRLNTNTVPSSTNTLKTDEQLEEEIEGGTNGVRTDKMNFTIRGIPEEVQDYIEDKDTFETTFKYYLYMDEMEDVTVAELIEYDVQEDEGQILLSFRLNDENNTIMNFAINLDDNSIVYKP